jgi:hypothetical protein
MFKWWKKMKARRIQDEVLREKTLANIDNEPWVRVVSVQFADPKNPSTGFFELDWNKAFVNALTEAGYSGRTDEDVVDMWFTDLCRGVTKEIPE